MYNVLILLTLQHVLNIITVAMTVSNIQLFKILKEKLGETQAESLVDFVEEKINSEFDDRKDNFATKEDLVRLETTLAVKIESSQKTIILWTIATMVTMFAISLTIIKLLQ